MYTAYGELRTPSSELEPHYIGHNLASTEIRFIFHYSCNVNLEKKVLEDENIFERKLAFIKNLVLEIDFRIQLCQCTKLSSQSGKNNCFWLGAIWPPKNTKKCTIR